ncbi:uncharacterized protein METZ01_LOCUS50908 [marine metagenome]|uniref:Rieske domain-containing protein n=1 Tax=marine metagenome TaxID=408172 RepID=A0A381S3N7_9ZZZZ|tara:strand:- start:4078 stop:4458 length:381 start_codon:yes stop_codon:yes gene_type:complete
MTGNKEFVFVADSTDIELGQSLSLKINGVQILICHTKDGIYAIEDQCTHANEPLCEGRIEGNLISCPVHGALFDVRNGEVKGPPASIKLRTFELKIDGTSIGVEKPEKTVNIVPTLGPGSFPPRRV